MKKQKNSSNDMMKIAIFLIVIVIFSFGFGMYIRNLSKPKILTEYANGFEFTKEKSSRFWSTTVINSQTHQEIGINNLRYSPSQVKDILVKGDPRIFMQRITESEANAAYFTYIPEGDTSNAALAYGNSSLVALAYADLATFLKKINGISLVLACTKNETGFCEKAPTISCENKNTMVIFLKPSNATSITMEESCLIIEGNGLNIAKAYNKLFFLWYGIL